MSIDTYFRDGLRRVGQNASDGPPRLGAELKFPLTRPDGSSVDRQTVRQFFQFLVDRGWKPIRDGDRPDGPLIGARKAGPMNDTVAACETGYSKLEFAMAHEANLDDLQRSINALCDEVRLFALRHDVRFLAYGIHPVTAPGRHLLQRQQRAAVWDRLLVSHDRIDPDQGHDGHLFTVNAGSHVHIGLPEHQAVPVVDVLNGFASAQIGLTANSNIWQGQLEHGRQSISESFWDWWRPATGRVGVPEQPFGDIDGYVRHIAELPVLFVKRPEGPQILSEPMAFGEFIEQDGVDGWTLDGDPVTISPDDSDLKVHNSCYWYNARVSRHFTVENRVFDQQTPDELINPSVLTLGLVSALAEAQEELEGYEWADLQEARRLAYRDGLGAGAGRVQVAALARRMLELAELGLTRLGRAEERFLEPLWKRLQDQVTPADEARSLFRRGGLPALIDARAL